VRANIIDGVDFGTIPDVLHELAKQALRDRDARRFLCLTDNMDGLGLVNRNSRLLLDLGIYEEALLDAFIGCRLNYHQFPLSTMKFLFAIANRDKLRAAGEALPQT